MPATMGQLIIFFLAVYTVPKINQPIETFAAVFPLSSPFAMMARAAQDATLWHHMVAITGQGFFVLLVLRLGVYLFRRNVMKSGRAGRVKHDGRRRIFGIWRW
jgi:ABC-2 type transport system permease protein